MARTSSSRRSPLSGQDPLKTGRPSPKDLDDRHRLEQVADYLSTIELALVKYEAKEDGEAYNKFFGGIGTFERNWLKQARSKRI